MTPAERAQREQELAVERACRNAGMVRTFVGGATIAEVAEQVGLSPNSTGAVLRANGARLPTSGRGFPLGRDFGPDRLKYEAGATARELAGEAGVSYGARYRGLASVGTEFRTRGRPPRR